MVQPYLSEMCNEWKASTLIACFSAVICVHSHLLNDLACSLIFLTLCKAINCAHSFIISKTTAILTVQIYKCQYKWDNVGYDMVFDANRMWSKSNEITTYIIVDFLNTYYHFYDSLGPIHNWKFSLRWVYWF